MYGGLGTTLNENQLCAGLPSEKLTVPFNGQHQEDFGGPLICLLKDKVNQKPIFTGTVARTGPNIRTTDRTITNRGPGNHIHRRYIIKFIVDKNWLSGHLYEFERKHIMDQWKNRRMVRMDRMFRSLQAF